MDPVRVHLGPMPPLWRAMIEELIGGEEDIVVVGSSDPGTPALVAARIGKAEILLPGEPGASSDRSLSAVVNSEPLVILSVKEGGESCVVISLKHRETPLEGLSLAEVFRSLQRAERDTAS